MLIKVDLPAPFSPTMPVIAPLAMLSDTPRTACTLPNDFWMPESSIAGAAITASTKAIFRHSRYFRQRAWCCRFRRPPTGWGCDQLSRGWKWRARPWLSHYNHGYRLCKRNRPPASLAGVVAHVVVDGDLARNDVGLGRIDLALHLRRHQLLVVLVERPVDAAL